MRKKILARVVLFLSVTLLSFAFLDISGACISAVMRFLATEDYRGINHSLVAIGFYTLVALLAFGIHWGVKNVK